MSDTPEKVRWSFVGTSAIAELVREALRAEPDKHHLRGVNCLPVSLIGPKGIPLRRTGTIPLADRARAIIGASHALYVARRIGYHCRADLISAALRAGKVVLAEPPLGELMPQVLTIARAAEAEPGTLIPVVATFWDVRVEAVLAEITGGAIGAVRSVKLEYTVPPVGPDERLPSDPYVSIRVHAPDGIAAALRLIEATGPAGVPNRVLAGAHGTSGTFEFPSKQKAILSWREDPKAVLSRLDGLLVVGEAGSIEVSSTDPDHAQPLLATTPGHGSRRLSVSDQSPTYPQRLLDEAHSAAHRRRPPTVSPAAILTVGAVAEALCDSARPTWTEPRVPQKLFGRRRLR